jgi:hypothetical protein
MVEKMKKEDKSLFGGNMERPIRDGRLYILIKLKRFKIKDSIRTSVCIATDHSILYQDFQ